jgi:zinc protease
LQAEPLSEQELQRIKTNAMAAHVYARDSLSEQAVELGMLEAIGLSWRVSDDYVERIKAITAQDVQKVAQKYLILERQTLLELMPHKAEVKPHA